MSTPSSTPLPYGYKLSDITDSGGHLGSYLNGPEKRTPWICVEQDHDKTGWNIKSNSDDRIPDSVRSIAFPTPEHAAAVGLAICLNHDRMMKEFAAPKPLIQAIESAERNVDALERHARDTAMEVAFTKSTLNSLRKLAGLPESEWRKDDLIERLDTFTLACASKQKHMKAPFFTQATLYDLLGKEDARSVLALVAQIKRRIDPVGGAL